MKLIKLFILATLLSGMAFAQQVRLSYELNTTEAGTELAVYAESNSASSVDIGALNLSAAHNTGCEATGKASSMLLDSWTDYLAKAEVVKGLKLDLSDQTFNRRFQWGNADPGLPQTSVVTLAPKGTRTLILTQQFKGSCQDVYLEHVSENSLNEIGNPGMEPMDYVIEHPQRPEAPELSFEVDAFPNPTKDFVTVEAKGLTPGEYTLRVTDLQGRMIQQVQRSFEQGDETRITVDLRGTSQGVYILDLSNDFNPAEAHAMRVVKE